MAVMISGVIHQGNEQELNLCEERKKEVRLKWVIHIEKERYIHGLSKLSSLSLTHLLTYSVTMYQRKKKREREKERKKKLTNNQFYGKEREKERKVNKQGKKKYIYLGHKNFTILVLV